MKDKVVFLWKEVGRLTIRFKKRGNAVISYRPSPEAIRKALAENAYLAVKQAKKSDN